MSGAASLRVLAALAALALGPAPVSAQSPPPAEHRHGQPPAPPAPGAAAQQPQDHSGHHGPTAHPPGLAPITDADRTAAFPQVEGHSVHDTGVNYFVVFDQLEFQTGPGDDGLSWDTKGWIGGDVNRFWFRTEGETDGDRPADAQVHLLYGRAIARWWEVVGGIRQDIRPGPQRTWAAVGLQGLAPYWFDVEATAYVGASGRTHFRFEVEHEVLLTNRLILQPLFEVEIYGKADRERGIGRGLSSIDAGLRLRYEIRREFAPYIGLHWHEKYFDTADLARAEGHRTGGARLGVGVRLWF
jgi:copper resistance protein B